MFISGNFTIFCDVSVIAVFRSVDVKTMAPCLELGRYSIRLTALDDPVVSGLASSTLSHCPAFYSLKCS
jgi:hypothetical protein